jgi:hypothetical protein
MQPVPPDAVKQAGTGIRSFKDTWADTTTPHGQLMHIILGGLAGLAPSPRLTSTRRTTPRGQTPTRFRSPSSKSARSVLP